jgi:hypothetical protein
MPRASCSCARARLNRLSWSRRRPYAARAVARLAELRAPKENVRVRVEAGRSDLLAYDTLCDALRGEHVV